MPFNGWDKKLSIQRFTEVWESQRRVPGVIKVKKKGRRIELVIFFSCSLVLVIFS